MKRILAGVVVVMMLTGGAVQELENRCTGNRTVGSHPLRTTSTE